MAQELLFALQNNVSIDAWIVCETSQSLILIAIRSVPTSSRELDVCSNCNSTMKPVYRAIFKVRDDEGSELAVLAMDEEAVSVFSSCIGISIKLSF